MTSYDFNYFIGRLNPPHNGHITTLQQMINASKQSNEENPLRPKIPALILLGSGPDGGIRTLEDPITYETKAEFIKTKLYGVEGEDYKIEKMSNSFLQVPNYISEVLTGNDMSNVTKITVYQYAGEKGNDTNKLRRLLNNIGDMIMTLHPNIEIKTDVKGVTPVETETEGEAMSATRVRKDAYRAYLNSRLLQDVERETDINDDGYDVWNNKYSYFYGNEDKDKDMSEKIYYEILFPALNLSSEEIENYINPPPKMTKRKNINDATGDPTAKSKKGGKKTNKKRRINKKQRSNKKRRNNRKRTYKRK
jgi:hypothetical protein